MPIDSVLSQSLPLLSLGTNYFYKLTNFKYSQEIFNLYFLKNVISFEKLRSKQSILNSLTKFRYSGGLNLLEET